MFQNVEGGSRKNFREQMIMEQSELYELLSFLISIHCQSGCSYPRVNTAGTLSPGAVSSVALSMESTKNESFQSDNRLRVLESSNAPTRGW